MESNEAASTTMPAAAKRASKMQAVGDLARRLPDAHKVIEKLHTTWKALVSRTTPAWKKALVALEALRLTWDAGHRKQETDRAGEPER